MVLEHLRRVLEVTVHDADPGRRAALMPARPRRRGRPRAPRRAVNERAPGTIERSASITSGVSSSESSTNTTSTGGCRRAGGRPRRSRRSTSGSTLPASFLVGTITESAGRLRAGLFLQPLCPRLPRRDGRGRRDSRLPGSLEVSFQHRDSLSAHPDWLPRTARESSNVRMALDPEQVHPNPQTPATHPMMTLHDGGLL